jgi:hypothetical protein
MKHKPFKIWPHKAAAIARQMWVSGDSVSAIARANGISRDCVLGKASKLQGECGSPGDSASAIARALGISRSAVLGKVWREGWPRRLRRAT